MKKINMLKKNYEFKKVLNKGIYYGGKQLDIFISRNNKKDNLVGIAIGKKSGNSVIRNRVKRLIRESYHLKEKEIEKGYNIVILWRKKIPGEYADFYIIKNDIEEIFRKADILRKEEK